ncbi:MAG: glycosyltransferase family 4 protein [Pseudobdellovibrio sp.]
MNLLIVSQFFKPETFIINDLALEMEALGHTITVLTGKPNYPEGDIYPGYKMLGVQKEMYGENIEIIRVPLWPRKKAGALNLVLNYLTYAISGTLLAPWYLRKKKIEAILVFAVSPITMAIPAIAVKFLKKAYLTIWVQDLWPQSLVVTSYVKNPLILKLVEKMVWCIYNCADLLMVQSKSFYEPILKIHSKAKLQYYPNSFQRIEPDLFAKKLPENLDHLLEENFCVVFAGNIGMAQSIETIIEAAKKLKGFNEKLKIVFVGTGAMHEWIKEQITQHSLDNVVCVGRYDMSYIPAIYAKSKVMLLTLKADEILKYTLPWKTQSYMAASRPIIGAIDGEGMRVIEEAKCGFAGPAENAEVLAQNIKKALQLSDEERAQLGRNGFLYYQNHFEMKSQVKNFFKIIESRMQK